MLTNRRSSRICCLDLDTFFVSVERLFDPSLVGKPVVVGASPGKRGVVTSASYEARRLGVHSGMSMADAQRLAPNAFYVPTRHGTYGRYASKVKAILERYCPEVRTASVDEFILDFRGCEGLYRRPEDTSPDATIERVVREMRQAVQDEILLPSSAGIGTSRTIAKIASGRAKPAGVLMVPSGSERDFLAPLSVRKFPGIGPVAEAKLNQAGIQTLDQLMTLPAGPTRQRFKGLVRQVNGICTEQRVADLAPERPAFSEHDRKGGVVGSISNERTFHADVGNLNKLEAQLLALVERVCWRARNRGVLARTFTLKLRFSNFETLSRSKTIAPTNSDLPVMRCLRGLLLQNLAPGRAVRLLGVAFSKLTLEGQQLSLPYDRGGRGDVSMAVDAVRDRFGYEAIRRGAAGGRSRWEKRSPHDGGSEATEPDQAANARKV